MGQIDFSFITILPIIKSCNSHFDLDKNCPDKNHTRFDTHHNIFWQNITTLQ